MPAAEFSQTLAALAMLVGSWIFDAAILLGVGALLRRAQGLRALPAEAALSTFWLGWAATLALLQLGHLARPIDRPAFFAWVALGALGLLASARELGRWRPGRVTVLTGVLAVLAAARATAPPLNYDTGLYHLAAIEWMASHPIVPGLGNLHGRLAFNSSLFPFAALLDAPARGLAPHLVSGLLLLPVLAEALGAARRAWSGSTAAVDVFRSAMLLPLAWRLRDPDLSSPTPDFALWMVGLALGSRLFGLLVAAAPAGPEEHRFEVGVVVALALAGLTVKLSFAGLALAGLTVLASVEGRALARPLACGLVALIAPWLLRGFLLSGYPVYPVPLLAAPVAWRVPVESVRAEAVWIAAWARAPGGQPETVLRDLAWLVPWARRLSSLPVAVDVALPASLGVVLVVLGARRAPRPPGLRFVLVPTASALAWFALAPDPRFAGATFWWLACAGAAFVGGPRTARRITALAALGFAIVTLHGMPEALRLAGGLQPAPQVPLRQAFTDSGLLVWVPASGDQAWRAPLPSAPGLDARLRLRRPGDLRSGFRRDATPDAP
jgi:hypothetical protein